MLVVGCSNNVKSSEDTNQSVSTTQALEQPDNDTIESKGKGLNLIKNFYGKTFKVEFNKSNGSIEEYTVYDKMGNAYSTVTVDFDSSKMVESIISTNESNEYDLNSIKTED